MKRILSLLLGLCLLGMGVCAQAETPRAQGGWECQTENPADIPQELVEAFAQAVEARADGYGYEPMMLLASQTVAGKNYCLLCRVTEAEGASFYAQVYLFVDLDGQSEIVRVQPLEYSAQAVRAPETTLSVMLDGEQAEVQAVLHEADGYSLYIPLGGWTLAREENGGLSLERWTSVDDEKAQLLVVDMSGYTPQEARAWIRAFYADYELLEDKRGGLFGSAKDGAMLMNATLDGAPETLFALIQCYPAELAEGQGVVLGAMVDTFLPS